MHYRYPDAYEVGREKIREHAVAVKNDDAFYFDEAVAAELGHDSLPAPLTAWTGLDALSHSLEALCAPGFHPMADGIATEAIRLIHGALEVAATDGQPSRQRVVEEPPAGIFGPV